MKIPCDIIDDLLPLYLDGECSEESSAAVKAHLNSCGVCRKKLERMRNNNAFPGMIKSKQEVSIEKYVSKVKHHRFAVCLSITAITVLSVVLLTLFFLTIWDMHIQSNPTIFQVEEGTYNLTSNDLTTTVSALDEYIFFTNYTQIAVSVPDDYEFDGEVLLWNANDRNNPVTILYGKITPDEKTCLFTGLSSSQRYMLTCDGSEDMVVLVSEGRNVSFFSSMKNVISMIMEL